MATGLFFGAIKPDGIHMVVDMTEYNLVVMQYNEKCREILGHPKNLFLAYYPELGLYSNWYEAKNWIDAILIGARRELYAREVIRKRKYAAKKRNMNTVPPNYTYAKKKNLS